MSEHAVRTLYGDGLSGILNAAQLELMVEHHRRIVESMPLEVDRKRLRIERSELEQIRLKLQTLMNEVIAKNSAADRDGAESRIAEKLPALFAAGDKVAFYAYEFAQDKAIESVEEHSGIANEIQQLVGRYRDLQLDEARNSLDVANATMRSMTIWVLLSALAAVILIGPIGLATMHKVLSRLSGITAVMARLARNETAIAIPSRDDSDEVGEMARAVEVFKENAVRLIARESELKELNYRMDTALNNMIHGLCMFDSDGRLVLCNERYIQMYRLQRDQVKPGCTINELLALRKASGTFLDDPDEYSANLRARIAEGKILSEIVEAGDGLVTVIVDQPIEGGGWVATFEDVTERLRVEHERDRSQKFLNTIVENAPVPIFVKEARGLRYVLVNRAGEKFWGTSRAEMIGKTSHDVFPKVEADVIAARDQQLLQSDRNGIRNIVSKRLTVCGHDGKSRYVIGVIEDVTERKHAERRIAYMAHHDALTDLPNRVLLRERLEQELTYVRRGGQLAVLYLDFDNFKGINDTLGHSIGDELLKAAADRLRGCLRDTDFIARLGGDEFAIVQTPLEQLTDAAILAQRLRDEMVRASFELNGHQIVVDISVGIALAPNDGTDADQLLKSSDMALYGAKSEGRGTYRYFEPTMDARMKARRALEVDLRKALLNSEFELYYQPIVNLRNNEVSGCEALLRWRHPARGIVPPAEFIPVAEETGLMIPIGEWVLRQACTDAASWPDDIKVAVNVSPVQLRNETRGQIVVTTLAASGLPPHRLELEITESLLMQNNEATFRTLHQLRELGVRIAMDDFGTGYSSLSYLRSFPFNKIKIDRSFIDDLSNSVGSLEIVQAVARLASVLNMVTTAEGVETERQLEIVRAAGCTEMQGYLFSRPRPAAEILRLISPRAAGVASAA
jgi:diguanylate cyclase (GGDEF)-like protein/PAS domain S-box-containing protein